MQRHDTGQEINIRPECFACFVRSGAGVEHKQHPQSCTVMLAGHEDIASLVIGDASMRTAGGFRHSQRFGRIIDNHAVDARLSECAADQVAQLISVAG